MNYDTLAQKHKEFRYKNYDVTQVSDRELNFEFLFELEPDITFSPSITIPFDKSLKVEPKVVDNLAFHIGLVEIPSYWKVACSPNIIVEAGYLDGKQIAFWKTIFTKGLGEFFYQNKIDFTKRDFINITSTAEINSVHKKYEGDARERTLVPLGGGKDSIVTLEFVKKEGATFNCLLLNPTKAASNVARIGECDNPVIIKRVIDPKLLELNQAGYLNGHTPFSAYLAFVCMAAAVMNDYKHIALSNEKSASDGNLEYLGLTVNHQWSKSFEFEKMFQEYSQKFLSREHHYFSNLRQLDELKIAEQFSRYSKYFVDFRSCNRGSKENRWCNECPKCLFVFTILYPFIPDKELIKIFGKNLLDEKGLEKLFGQLAGISENKPFECVGTANEMKQAIKLGLNKSADPPFLLQSIKDKI
jgi:UDP-N-acetyl-alpha-D-muramoyl-L-alanyl-L-glutamate epimerase